MPTYDFRDSRTGDIFERVMKIAEKEQFLKDNPHIESYLGNHEVNLGDPVRLGIRKADGGFREVLQKIHSRTPGSRLNTIADI